MQLKRLFSDNAAGSGITKLTDEAFPYGKLGAKYKFNKIVNEKILLYNSEEKKSCHLQKCIPIAGCA